MKFRDKVGVGISNFLFPYIQGQYQTKGDYMKRPIDREQYITQEKYLWFLGSEDLLADFYKTKTHNYSVVDTRAEFYYSNAGNNIRIVHSGLPSLISYTKSRLLTSGGIEYNISIKDKEDIKAKELLTEMFKDNKLDKIIKNSATTESWGNGFAWKISFDDGVSELPIVELYKPQHYKSVYKRGRLTDIIFFNYYEKDNTEYRLEEIYGKGYIKYSLFMLNKDGSEVRVALTDLEETSELNDVSWAEKIMLGGEKHLEKGDYDGLTSEFDALDETWSQLMDEIRLGRSEVYVPEMLMTNRTFNKFRKNYAELGNDERENGKNEIKHIQPDIRVEQYAKAIREITSNCLIAVGLSPFTVGIDDNIGANSSGESLAKREASSLRTRNEMIKEWESFLEEMFRILLFANHLFNKTKYSEDYEITVSFGDYISPTRRDIIEETKLMVDASIIDTEKAIDEIYGNEITEAEKLRMLANMGDLSTPLEFEEE